MSVDEIDPDYHEKSRRGEPLYPDFAECPETGKAAITDRVRLAWTWTVDEEWPEPDIRGSGVLEPAGDEGVWAFVQLHVSAPHEG
jgi:hypothetical protein